MTSKTLMLGLLALDSYNRGSYSEIRWGENQKRPGIGAPTTIGNATFASERDRETFSEENSPRQNSTDNELDRNGFYAAAYNFDGAKIIAVRGTDNLGLTSPNASDDLKYGYTIAFGYPGRLGFSIPGLTIDRRPQSYDAIEFYKQIVGPDDLKSNDVELTGHSMGGGIAGRRARHASDSL